MSKDSNVALICDFFGGEGQKVTLEELKQLTTEDRTELGALIKDAPKAEKAKA